MDVTGYLKQRLVRAWKSIPHSTNLSENNSNKSNIFPNISYFLFSLGGGWNFNYKYDRLFDIFSQCFVPLNFYFNPFSLCFSVWIISMSTSLSSLVLSSTLFNLLMSPSKVFCILFTVVFLFLMFYIIFIIVFIFILNLSIDFKFCQLYQRESLGY